MFAGFVLNTSDGAPSASQQLLDYFSSLNIELNADFFNVQKETIDSLPEFVLDTSDGTPDATKQLLAFLSSAGIELDADLISTLKMASKNRGWVGRES